MKLADVLLTLLFSALGAAYIRAKAPGLAREAEEKRAGELREYIADQDRIMAGLRDEVERMKRELEGIKGERLRERKELEELLRERYETSAYVRACVAIIKTAGLAVPVREEGG